MKIYQWPISMDRPAEAMQPHPDFLSGREHAPMVPYAAADGPASPAQG
jgi:hypothetical protein